MTALLLLASLLAAPATPGPKPRVLVLAFESEVVDGALDWRSGPEGFLADTLRDRARVVNLPARARRGGAELATRQFEPSTLVPLGRRAKADIVLAVFMRIRVVPGKSETTVRGTGEVIAFDVTTAETLSSLTLPANGRGAARGAATDALYAQWSESFAPLLDGKILAAWWIQSKRGAAFRLTLDGGQRTQRLRFARALERVPKVTEVRTLAALDERLSLEVRFRGTGEGLVRGVFQHLARRRPFRGLTRVGRTTAPIALEFSR